MKMYMYRTKFKDIDIIDFDFKFSGYGHCKVTYTSPVTGKQWKRVTDNMPLIDVTKNASDEDIKRVDLITLKRICKS